ncbi:MAG: alpha/beta hydrolase [Hyphomicrobiaceae bacterium]
MAALDMEKEYNNRMRVPENAEINARWSKASEAYRKEARCDLDKPYGKGARQRYDLFHAKTGGQGTPLVVYIHGGYWQRGERAMYSFIAKELNALGVSVAIPSYSLCPAVSVMDIVGELQQCLKAIHEHTKARPVVAGHSAGGHLTAALLATDWSKITGAPKDLVRSGYAISGVFDLPPLVGTSINDAVKLDAAKAREASPLFWPSPGKGKTLVAAVGGAESQEFIRQSLAIADAWSKTGVTAECVVVPGANHFTILDELGRAESAMVARLAGLAKA